MLTYTIVILVALAWYILSYGREGESSKYVFFLYMLAVALFVGFGDMIGGYDRYIYGSSFDAIADGVTYNTPMSDFYYLVNGKEYGYLFWQELIAQITENRYIFIFITTLAEYAMIYYAIKKYCDDYPLVTIIFLGFFYYFTMTYLREVMAVGILWLSTRFIWERKPIPFFALVLLGATFHTAVLIYGVMYFMPIRKFDKNTILTFLVICFIIGLTPFGNAVIAFAGDVTNKVGDFTEQDQGFRIEYVLEVIFITFILFYNYDKISEDSKTLTFLNMCWALCGILFIFMRFGQGGRFGWPFFLGLFYMLPYVCNANENYPWLRSVVVLVCFALFMRITIVWSPMMTPYKTFLTDGIPSGEGVYENYEYDERYSQDKFYRPAFRFQENR